MVWFVYSFAAMRSIESGVLICLHCKGSGKDLKTTLVCIPFRHSIRRHRKTTVLNLATGCFCGNIGDATEYQECEEGTSVEGTLIFNWIRLNFVLG